jgi:hypothetical protein
MDPQVVERQGLETKTKEQINHDMNPLYRDGSLLPKPSSMLSLRLIHLGT